MRVVLDFEFSLSSVTNVDLHIGTLFEIEYDMRYQPDWSEHRDNEVYSSSVKRVLRSVIVSLNLERVISQKTNPEL